MVFKDDLLKSISKKFTQKSMLNAQRRSKSNLTSFIAVAVWYSGYHYCTTSFNKA